MSDKPLPPSLESDIPEATVSASSSSFSAIWLLPLIAALVAGWLAYKTVSDRGPSIEIHFKTADGIEAGKTLVKYREVEVGKVESVRYADDFSNVIVEVSMKPGTENQLSESTRFWVERARVGTEGISGLGTLVSGSYIALDPGREGDSSRQFVGLEQPPGITSDTEGTLIKLRAKQLGSLYIGSPVYYRQIPVGKILNYALSEDHESVDITIFVGKPHDNTVRSNTRFWNAAGLDLRMDANGLAVKVESITSLLAGGIAFETPRSLNEGTAITPDTRFPLYDNYEQSLEQPVRESETFVLHFEDTVRGLTVGAPVEFRGIRIGTVTEIALKVDPTADKLTIPVLIDIEPSRMEYSQQFLELPPEQQREAHKRFLEQLVAHGMRARLQSGNLITGQLFVDFDFVADAEPLSVNYDGRFPELPTVPRPLLGIMTSASNILSKLEHLPIEAIGKDVQAASASITQLMTRSELTDMLVNLEQASKGINQIVTQLSNSSGPMVEQTSTAIKAANKVIKQAENTLASFEQLANPESPTGHELYRALQQLADAARSIRVMADYLERHPEALIQGKPK